MGYVSLRGPDGQVRAQATYGADQDVLGNSDIANDGYIHDVEISAARESLEKEINAHICGYGGPLGLGGWGGVNEVCVQPWNMGGPSREQTPDGYSMKAKLQVFEDYRERMGYVFYTTKQTEPKEVEITIRWESGRVRLYQGNPLPYQAPAPLPPAPDLAVELKKAGNYLWAGVGSFMNEIPAYTASLYAGMLSFTDEVLATLTPDSRGQDPMAGIP